MPSKKPTDRQPRASSVAQADSDAKRVSKSPPATREDRWDCCDAAAPFNRVSLRSTNSRELDLAQCPSCSTWWLAEVHEVAMGSEFEEMIFRKYAKLTAEEAQRLSQAVPDGTLDLSFLADRSVLSGSDGFLRWKTGWG